MSVREIVKEGDPVLGKVCHAVVNFDERLANLMDDLRDTLADSNGVGLAAPQIGILRRAVVVLDPEDNMIELINPEIIKAEGEQTGLEGCLSVPGKYGVVTRPMDVTVRAQDRSGNFFEVSGTEITARCFCHELEHLDGHLFVERADQLFTPEELEAMEAEEE